MKVEKTYFGKTSKGEEVSLYTMTNSNGIVVKVSDFGAVLVELHTPDREGVVKDIVLGYDNVNQYEKNAPGFGAVIGRHANRIGKASFMLNGKKYELEKNDGENNLHSGTEGYQKRMWSASCVEEKSKASVEFSLHSPDNDQGFPANLEVTVCYTLAEDNTLTLSYKAVPDADTIINLTNHTYFNLAGHDFGDVLSHKVWIDSDFFTCADEQAIPTGEIVSVKGTPMDFNEKKAIGLEIDSSYEATLLGHGYDHNWVLKTAKNKMSLIASMEEETSGRGLKVYTNLPGVQFYTGNFLDGTEIGKNGVVYQRRSGACFETQYFPDSMHHENFPSDVFKKGNVYSSETKFEFYVIDNKK